MFVFFPAVLLKWQLFARYRMEPSFGIIRLEDEYAVDSISCYFVPICNPSSTPFSDRVLSKYEGSYCKSRPCPATFGINEDTVRIWYLFFP